MALAKVAISLFLTILSLSVVSAAVYKVGDDAGWTTIGNIDYAKWASNKTFLVGDTILFEYHTQFHNVLQVNHTNFRSCNAKAPITTYATGNDSITIKRSGHLYFLCGFPGHCLAGQKVDIRVSSPSGPSSSPSAAPAPSISPSSDTTPSPSKNNAPSLSGGKLWIFVAVLAFSLARFV